MMGRTSAFLGAVDRRLLPVLRRWSVPLLRVSLGVVFVWFGALKAFQVSPVADLVAATVYWVDPTWFVPALGLVEVGIGLGVLARVLLRLLTLLLAVHLAGTFGILVILPGVAFSEGNPLLLTTEGEFVVKNLVLLSAALVVASTIHQPSPDRGPDAVS